MENKKYLLTDFIASARVKKILNILKNYKKNIRILDVGCGSGYYVSQIKTFGFYNIKGLDLISKAEWIVNEPDFIMDARNTSFKDNTFDIILAIEILEHVNCINEIKRILKKDGLLIATTPSLHTNWIHKIVEFLNIGETQDGGSKKHKLIDLKNIDMKLLKYEKMFFNTSQFAIFKNEFSKANNKETNKQVLKNGE